MSSLLDSRAVPSMERQWRMGRGPCNAVAPCSTPYHVITVIAGHWPSGARHTLQGLSLTATVRMTGFQADGGKKQIAPSSSFFDAINHSSSKRRVSPDNMSRPNLRKTPRRKYQSPPRTTNPVESILREKSFIAANWLQTQLETEK